MPESDHFGFQMLDPEYPKGLSGVHTTLWSFMTFQSSGAQSRGALDFRAIFRCAIGHVGVREPWIFRRASGLQDALHCRRLWTLVTDVSVSARVLDAGRADLWTLDLETPGFLR